MKHSHIHLLAILPLMSILCTSPMKLDSSPSERGIASVEEDTKLVSKYPKYTALADKFDLKGLLKDNDLTVQKVADKSDDLMTKLIQEQKDFKLDLIEKDISDAQQLRVIDIVNDLIALEQDVKTLQEKKLLTEEYEAQALKIVNTLKIGAEDLLTKQSQNEQIIARSEALDAEMKNDQLMVTRQEANVAEDAYEASKKPQVAPASEPVCEISPLTASIDKLIASNQDILKSMMDMTKMMMEQMGRMQAQYQQPQQQMLQNQPQMMNPYPYIQAAQPQGQWAYFLPQGMQPQQMYQQPQQQPQQQLQQSNFGNNIYDKRSQSFDYNMGPQRMQSPNQQFENRYYAPQQVIPGNFGQSPYSFNFSQSGPQFT